MFATITTGKIIKEKGYMLTRDVESNHMTCSVKVALIELYTTRGQTLSPRLEEVTYQKLGITYQFGSWRALFSPLLYHLSYLGSRDILMHPILACQQRPGTLEQI